MPDAKRGTLPRFDRKILLLLVCIRKDNLSERYVVRVLTHPTAGVQQNFLSSSHEELNISPETCIFNKFVRANPKKKKKKKKVTLR
eukprot:TRINITY_DN380_c0_g2_i4.p1 TRINITY_DN380_c0_g2~~TRINITY_DN380_c0_g2_i4.p1  ORF type:complete len:86 (+),score=10.90 TRINITY_DN380_c0_g2_i4:156-413(+)